jgi:uncharacterized membrane protein YhhN
MPWLLLCTLSVLGLLVAERRRSQRGKWLTKPIASVAFVATALASGALDSRYGVMILTGLVLSLLGDVLLIPQGRTPVFRAGVIAFLLGHVAFMAAFLTQRLDMAWFVGAAIVLGLVLWRVWRWLRPSLPDDMRKAVFAYLIVIGTMSTFALAWFGAGGPAIAAIGALAFTASDVSVARDRFVHEEFLNRAWGLPLYYAAQVLLALSVAAVP